MPIDYDKLLARKFPDVESAYSWRDCILYALGLGLGSDPLSRHELRFVYENGLAALPTMATVLGYPGYWIGEPDTGIDDTKVVHGEQSLVIHHPLAVEGILIGRTRITDIADKGVGRGAVVQVETELRDKLTGRLQSTRVSSVFCRGDGGFGGPPGLLRPSIEIPDTVPDLTVLRAIPTQASLIYRLSGDYNPLHADPAAAQLVGFDRPILHGFATYGIAGYCLFQACAGGDEAALRTLSCRFTAPLFPGETLRTDIWGGGDEVMFRCTAVERDVVVLDRGTASFG